MPWYLSMTLSIGLPLIVVYSYVAIRLHFILSELFPVRRALAKRVLMAATVFLNVLPISAGLAYWVGGRPALSIFAGESALVDLFIVYPYWIGLVVVVQTFFVFLVTDIVTLLARFSRGQKDGTASRSKAKVMLLIFVLIVGYSLVRIVVDTWTVRISEHELEIDPQFSALDGLRFVVIADIQGDRRTSPTIVRRYVEKAQSLQPDIVLFAGDLVTSGEHYIESTAKELGRLRSRYANIAAVGDHDIFTNRMRVRHALEENGFTTIEDSTVMFAFDGTSVAITVLTETYRQRITPKQLARATDTADGVFRVMLVHQPANRLIQEAAERGYHLFVAGHTHGGAIAFGIPGIYLWAPSRVENRYFTGFHRVGRMLVTVNNGLGHTLTCIRYQAPVEVSVVRLRVGSRGAKL